MSVPSVLITGAASGIGLATTEALLALNWRVFAGVMPHESIDTTQWRNQHQLTLVPIDITNPHLIQQAIEQIQAESTDNGLMALVNNAGILVHGPLEAIPMNQLRAQFDVNVFGHLQVIRASLPLLRQASAARIINVSSLWGRMTVPFLGAYSMSKFALESLSDTLRQELKPWDIKVIVIQPGAVDTGMFKPSQTVPYTRTTDQPPDPMKELYHQAIQENTEALVAAQANSIPAAAVAAIIVKALTVTNPKTRYIVGADARALALCKWLLPDFVVDAILARALQAMVKRSQATLVKHPAKPNQNQP